MFTLLFYTGVCAVVAGLVTVFATLFKPIHRKGDSKPWFTWAGFFVIIFAIPYVYTEGLTKMYGDKMKGAIAEAYSASDIQGPMNFYRIIGYRPDKEATAIAIGTERETWGGTDRPAVSIHLVKKGDAWAADRCSIVYCDRLNKDGYLFPPYW